MSDPMTALSRGLSQIAKDLDSAITTAAGHAAAWRRIPSCFDMTDAEIVYRAMLAADNKESTND